MNEIASLEDDGLLTPTVGTWGLVKYRLLGLYIRLFATGMKKKWDRRVYIDLFSGPGRARLGPGGAITNGSPLIALKTRDPFDKYIFCESDVDKMAALRERVNREHPGADVDFIDGDVNTKVSEILSKIPRASKDLKVLSLCVADPYNLSDLRFETVRGLSRIFVDFFVLIPTFMEANRFQRRILKEDRERVDVFLGDNKWHAEWNDKPEPKEYFGTFILQQYCNRIAELKYRMVKLQDAELVRWTEDKNQRLYHLAVFSRHARAEEFWKRARENADSQRQFDLGV